MARFLVTVSVALNLLLLTTIVAARVDIGRSRELDTRAAGSLTVNSVQPDFDLELDSGDRVGPVYAALRARGVGHAATRPLIAAWLARRGTELMRREVIPYWLARDPGADAARSQRMDFESSARGELVEIFGGAVATDPDFAALFEPLGPRFSFLTATEQAALQRELLAAERGISQRGAPACRLVGAARMIEPAGLSAVPGAKALGPDAAFEYGLRVSPLAAQLRQADLDLTELEFRRAFGLLVDLSSNPTVGAQSQIRDALKDLLGEPRFDRLWSLRDPIYPHVRRVLGGQGLHAPTIDAAYGVMNRAQEQLLAAAQHAADPERLAELARSVVREERRGLELLVGADATRALISARARIAREPRWTGDC